MPTDPTPRPPRRHGREDSSDVERNDPAEFWGDARTWDDVAPQRREAKGTVTSGRLRRWWNSVPTAGPAASRTHGTADAHESQDAVAWHDQEDHADWDVDAWDHEHHTDGWDVEPAPVRGSTGIDPLIARLGAVIVVATVAVSVAMGVTSDAGGGGQVLQVSAATTLGTAESLAGEPSTDSSGAGVSTEPAATGGTTTTDSSTSTAVVVPSSSPAPPSTDSAEVQGDAAALMAESEPETTVPACGSDYELAPGDYWIRIADASDVTLAELLTVNRASVDTVLVPGRSICLPVGASTPAPPTSAPAPTTTTPKPTATTNSTTTTNTPPSSRTTPTTAAPTTTSTVPARPAAVPTSQAEAIIREVWPDDLEARALEIAWRESNHQSNVNNYCCYGLFQIHWSAHRSWLATIGVTSAAQLYDPLVNANVAYALYQRSGGFGPWGG